MPCFRVNPAHQVQLVLMAHQDLRAGKVLKEILAHQVPLVVPDKLVKLVGRVHRESGDLKVHLAPRVQRETRYCSHYFY